MLEKEKIQEAYETSILNESAENQVSQAITKVFSVKVKKIELKKKIVFHLSDFVDEGDMDNFSKMDAVTDFIKKKYKDAIIDWKGRTIEVTEL